MAGLLSNPAPPVQRALRDRAHTYNQRGCLFGAHPLLHPVVSDRRHSGRPTPSVRVHSNQPSSSTSPTTTSVSAPPAQPPQPADQPPPQAQASSSAVAVELPGGDPPDLAALVRRLDQLLLEAAADPRDAAPGARAGGAAAGGDAEVKAVALAERGRELGLLRGFGAGRQIPKRIYTIEELRLNRIEAEKLLSPKDTSLNSVRTIAQAAAAVGLVAAAWVNHWDAGGVLAAIFGVVFTLTADQVANGGGGEALLVDSLGRLLQPSYAARVAHHEAGHLLVAYMVGLLPRAYTLSSLDALLRYRALNIQAGTRFCDSAFAAEVAVGRLKASSLERYTCVALAGVVTEYLYYGVAEGGLGDVQQLDNMFRALQFTQKKADGEVRWAVLNCASILRRHARLHDELAKAMRQGKSVGQCIELIERRLIGCQDI